MTNELQSLDTMPEVKAAQKNITGLVQVAKAITKIEDEAQVLDASDIAVQIKTKAKEVEAIRTSITKPLNDSVTRVNAFFKDLAQAPDTVIVVQQMPVDAQSTTILKSDQERGTPEAPRFAFHLIRKL